MQDLNDKVTGGTLSAAEWNQPASELQNLITPAGMALSSGDLAQVQKSMSYWVSRSAAFTASTDVSGNITLTPITGSGDIFALADGMRLRFLTTVDLGVATTGITLTVGAFTKNITRKDGSALSNGTYGLGILTDVQYNLADDRWESTEGLAGENGACIKAANIDMQNAVADLAGKNRVPTVENLNFQRKRAVVSTPFVAPGSAGGAVGFGDVITPLNITLDSVSSPAFYRVTYRLHTTDVAGAAFPQLAIYLDFGAIGATPAEISAKVTCSYPAAWPTAGVDDISMIRDTVSSDPAFYLLSYQSDDVRTQRFWTIEVIAPATGGDLRLRIANGNFTDGTVDIGSSVVAELIG